MIIAGFDPGKATGVAVLDTDTKVVLRAEEWSASNLAYRALSLLRDNGGAYFVYERTTSYGRGFNADMIDTTEIAGYLRHGCGAVGITRPEVLRLLGFQRGASKGAVWSEVMSVLGADDRGGKLCPKRNSKSHREDGPQRTRLLWLSHTLSGRGCCE